MQCFSCLTSWGIFWYFMYFFISSMVLLSLFFCLVALSTMLLIYTHNKVTTTTKENNSSNNNTKNNNTTGISFVTIITSSYGTSRVFLLIEFGIKIHFSLNCIARKNKQSKNQKCDLIAFQAGEMAPTLLVCFFNLVVFS